jgi:transcriptional regulator with XRE-family HTH domain
MQTRLRRMTLPELLERYRVYTIRDFADRTGLSRQYAWNLWHGAAGLGRRNLERLHEALGIPLEELLQVERPQPARPPRPKARPGRKPQHPAPEAAAPVELSPQERKAALLARLQQMQTAGMTLQAMANQLNAEGRPTISGRGRWLPGTISNLLADATSDS